MKKSEVTVGMEVTLTVAMYGEHFGNSPQQVCRNIHHTYCIHPGMKGIVGSVDIPVVCHTPGNPMSFVCVDFVDLETGCRFRVRPWYHQIRKYDGG